MWWEYILFYVLSGVALLIFAKLINQKIFNINLNEYLNVKDNVAVGVEVGGQLFGVIYIITSSMFLPVETNFLLDLGIVLVNGIVIILLTSFLSLMLSRILVSKNINEQIKAGNVPSAIVMASTFVAISMMTTGVVRFQYKSDILPIIIFLIVGILTFIAVTSLFRYLTSYDDVKEIENGNMAAGFSYGGLIIAIGIVISNALTGDFTTYEAGLWGFLDSAIIVLLMYPVRQFLIQGLIMGCGYKLYGGKLDDEIARDRNIGAGVIEAAIYIATAIFAVKFIDVL
jgi:uncharacterized membrane protein YjfL (UPF0719 family)